MQILSAEVCHFFLIASNKDCILLKEIFSYLLHRTKNCLFFFNLFIFVSWQDPIKTGRKDWIYISFKSTIWSETSTEQVVASDIVAAAAAVIHAKHVHARAQGWLKCSSNTRRGSSFSVRSNNVQGGNLFVPNLVLKYTINVLSTFLK